MYQMVHFERVIHYETENYIHCTDVDAARFIVYGRPLQLTMHTFLPKHIMWLMCVLQFFVLRTGLCDTTVTMREHKSFVVRLYFLI